MGFKPASAAPTAKPAKPISVIGVSMIRFSLYLSSKPLLTIKNSKLEFLTISTFVCAVVLSNFFAHQKHFIISLQFFIQCRIQSLTNSHLKQMKKSFFLLKST
eukprot:Pompholyxophrys_punicea_v1_NODE_1473_length_698_cov_1.125972.p1 type:complete len:103 gc:universal NODE_1473_length_698_cov_1.125972:114-422(+)